MIILNGDDETITYDKNKDKLWIKEIFHEGNLIGINVMVNEELVDTYEEDDCAKQIVKFLFNTNEDQIDIEQINWRLEVY